MPTDLPQRAPPASDETYRATLLFASMFAFCAIAIVILALAIPAASHKFQGKPPIASPEMRQPVSG
jgi:hypothetical protein